MKTIEQLLQKALLLRSEFTEDKKKEPSHIVISAKYKASCIDEIYNMGNPRLSFSNISGDFYIHGLTVIWGIDIDREFCVLH